MSDETHGHEHGGTRVGWLVFLALAALTVIEYIIAVELNDNLPVIMGIAVVKAALIIWYFMHVARLWLSAREED
jgi:caa(3)-type oxidase subunit IV